MGLEGFDAWRGILGVKPPDDLELCIIFLRLQVLAGHDYTAQRVQA